MQDLSCGDVRIICVLEIVRTTYGGVFKYRGYGVDNFVRGGKPVYVVNIETTNFLFHLPHDPLQKLYWNGRWHVYLRR